MVKKLPEPFMSKNYKKTSPEFRTEKQLSKNYKKTSPEFRTEKVIKKKVINCMSNGKDMIILLIVG